jgi:hypothetical protein
LITVARTRELLQQLLPFAVVIAVVQILWGSHSFLAGFTLAAAVMAAARFWPALMPRIRRFFRSRDSVWALVLFVCGILLLFQLGIITAVDVWLDEFPFDEFGSWGEWFGGLTAAIATWVARQTLWTTRNLTAQTLLQDYLRDLKEIAVEDGVVQFTPIQAELLRGGFETLCLAELVPAELARVFRMVQRIRGFSALSRDRRTTQINQDDGYPLIAAPSTEPDKTIRLIALEEMEEVLMGKGLPGQHVPNIDFRYALLTDFNLRKANLKGANFALSTLTQVNFSEACLIGAKFYDGSSEPHRMEGGSGAEVMNCDFTNALLNEDQARYLLMHACHSTRRTLLDAKVIIASRKDPVSGRTLCAQDKILRTLKSH